MGMAEALARDGSRSTEQQVSAIKAAAFADSPPPLGWFMWAVDVLQYQLKDALQSSQLKLSWPGARPVGMCAGGVWVCRCVWCVCVCGHAEVSTSFRRALPDIDASC